MNAPVFSRLRRNMYDQRMNMLRFCINVALYGPMPQWPQYTHIG